MMPESYVYVMSNPSRTFYIGVTSDLERRVWQHKQKQTPGFTSRYNVTMLVYFETFADIRDAIAHEKELKGWMRWKKIELIEAENSEWRDLSDDWYQ